MGVQHESISSDEENETSFDVSDLSDCEHGSLTDSDDGVDTHADAVPCTRSQHNAAQVCALCLLTIMVKTLYLDYYCYLN